MPRKPPQITAEDERFAALAQMKARLRPHDGRPAPDPVKASPPPADDGEEDVRLFRANLRGVTPMASSNLAQIERPRAAPIPRPRPVEAEPEPIIQDRMPQGADALFRAAYQDVVPIKDSGRVDLATAAHRKPPTGVMAHLEEEPPIPEDLSHDPAALFRLAMRGASPLPDTGRLHIAQAPPAAIPRQKELNEKEVLQESLSAPITFEDRLDMGDEAAFLRPGLPRRVLTDLRRGRWVVQKQLDLHGLTRDEARAALATFLGACLKDGQRCLRLIHGKGLGSPGGEPVLKHLSKSWLSQREEILAFCQARPHDGGAGALLVLLRSGQAN
ncbi:MAG: Smr/MutS family protein [Rhodocyclaceae bacterium]|nr:Smr/MutS family protein [Rhodocyclaceae bacterium]